MCVRFVLLVCVSVFECVCMSMSQCLEGIYNKHVLLAADDKTFLNSDKFTQLLSMCIV